MKQYHRYRFRMRDDSLEIALIIQVAKPRGNSSGRRWEADSCSIRLNRCKLSQPHPRCIKMKKAHSVMLGSSLAPLRFASGIRCRFVAASFECTLLHVFLSQVVGFEGMI